MTAATVAAIREVSFAQHRREGALTVFPGGDRDGVPFPIARVFTIGDVPAGGTRGNHAHRACTQLFVCLAGEAELRVDDGRDTRSFALASPARGILVPPGLWNVIRFAGPATLIAVFCDLPHDERDYIRDRGEYLRMQAGRARAGG